MDAPLSIRNHPAVLANQALDRKDSIIIEGEAGKSVSSAVILNGGNGLLSLDPSLVTCPTCKGECAFVDGEDSWSCRECDGKGRVVKGAPLKSQKLGLVTCDDEGWWA